jgi:hypothetical protein
MPPTEYQREQQERHEVLRSEQRLREADQRTKDRSGTYLSQTHIDDAGGRFKAVNSATVVGAEPLVKYPQLPSSSPWSGAQPEPGIGPPLGYEINRLTPYELEPSMVSVSPVEAQAGPADAPSTGFHSPGSMSEHTAGPPTSSRDPAGVHFPSPPDTFIPNVDAGSPPKDQTNE